MTKYTRKFKESLEVITTDDGVVKLSDNSYHFHTQDIADGMVPIEMEKLGNICQILNIDQDSFSMLQLMECYRELYDIVQISSNIRDI